MLVAGSARHGLVAGSARHGCWWLEVLGTDVGGWKC